MAEEAERHLNRVLLELGGKAPIGRACDADYDPAGAAANLGAFMHQGQICMSTELVLVDRSVADQFAERPAERANGLKIGDPREQITAIGPLVKRPR